MIRIFAFIFVLFLSGASLAIAQDSHITIENAYALPTAPGQTAAAVFMTVKNNSDAADKITGATTEIAEKAELHTMSMDGDVMKMRSVESYDIPAKGTLELKPSGGHIMLTGLKQQLEPGKGFVVNLTLENSKSYTLNVDVRDHAEAPAASSHDQHSHH